MSLLGLLQYTWDVGGGCVLIGTATIHLGRRWWVCPYWDCYNTLGTLVVGVSLLGLLQYTWDVGGGCVLIGTATIHLGRWWWVCPYWDC